MAYTRIVGTGSALAGRVVSNREICQRLPLDPEGVFRRTGIHTRHWASESQATSDLAEEAGRKALEAAGLPATALDAILVSTTSPDMPFPSTACHLQHRLAARPVAAFDVAASCSGFLYALSMADALVRAGQVRCCLVAGAEIKSRSLDLDDEATAPLFGDGAGAAVVVREDGPEAQTPGRAGLLRIRLYADGARQGLLEVPAGGSRVPASAKTLQEKQHNLRMQGAPLFRAAVRRLVAAVQDLLAEFGLGVADVDQAIFHQANRRLLMALAERLGLADDTLFTVIEDCGNTSSASLPITLDRAVRADHVRPGDLVLLGTFGGGLTWGAGLVRW